AENGRQPDHCRRARLELAVERVRHRPHQRDQGNGGERGGHRGPCAVARGQDQERHDDDPAADAEERAEEAREEADGDEPHGRILGPVEENARRLLAPLAEDPARAAILLDVDGTLAPIVARPELAEVPEAARTELRRLLLRYALVACISGRTGRDAWRLVGVDGITFVGVHGLELAPEAEAWRPALHTFSGLDWPWVEDKGLTVAFHWREAPDED